MLLKAINAIMIPLFLIDLISGIIKLNKNTEKEKDTPDESGNSGRKENIENDDSGNTEETEDEEFDNGGNIELDSDQQSFPMKDNNCEIIDNKQSEITEKLTDKNEDVTQIEYNQNNTIGTMKETVFEENRI